MWDSPTSTSFTASPSAEAATLGRYAPASATYSTKHRRGVDGTEILSTNNAPLGWGYDYLGKRYFLNVRYLLGGPGAL